MPLTLRGSGQIDYGTSTTIPLSAGDGKVYSKVGFYVQDDGNQMALSVAAASDSWGLWFDTSASAVGGVGSKTSTYFGGDGNVLSFIGSGVARFSVSLNNGSFFSWYQRTMYDRAWDNYPSISVYNDTTNGPCAEYRIHGLGGVSGGDFSVVTRCDGGFITGSDARRKINVEPITNALEKVLKLQGKTFNIINRDGEIDQYQSSKKMGFIAQEAIKVIPESVSFDKDADTPNEKGWASAYAVDYSSVVPLLTEAIKELKEQLDAALARIAELEK